MPYAPKSPAEALLTTVGLPLEDLEKISTLTEDEQKTFDPKPYSEKVKANYQTQLQNDPAFFTDMTIEKLPPSVKKMLESGQYARATNVAKSALAKSLGFNAEEVKDLEADDFKALEKYIPAITEKWTKTKAGDKELQQQLIEARKKAEQYGPDYEKGVETKYETQAEQKVTAAVLDYNVVADLSSIPNLKINAVDVSKTATEILVSRYGYARVGNLVELRQKANPEMKVLKTNSSQELTLKEALIEIATERGWIEKEKVVNGSGVVTTVTPTNGQLFVAPHLQDKISKKIAEEGK